MASLWIFYDHLVHFVFIWYILSGFGIMKNLATLARPVYTNRILKSMECSDDPLVLGINQLHRYVIDLCIPDLW
jgi:hypothetical protein